MQNSPRLRIPMATLALTAGALTIALILSACGGDAQADQSSGVATLEDVETTGEQEPATGDAGSELAAEEAVLLFSQCMRDEGIDFPDIGVDAEGNPHIRAAFQEGGVQPGSADFRTAMESCGDLLDGAAFGGGRGGRQDSPEVQDAFVAFSECLRDQGLDVGDLQLGGGGAQGVEDGTQPGEGQGRGQFGDRNSRIASTLGVDPDDPEAAAALDTCSPILDTAFDSALGEH